MSPTPTVMFVCWGNICRSPMAEVVAREWARREGVEPVEFTSSGVSDEEAGNPIDPRAAAVLNRAGYRPAPHRAHLVTADEVRSADLVIAMEPLHLNRLRRLAPDADNLHLLTEFDPDAAAGSGIPDPWYGSPEGFNDTLAAIEAAMPGLIRRTGELLARSG